MNTNTLAENLAYYRKKNNFTQAQLGDLLHVSAQAISKWENGQAEPGLDMILKLAEIYGITTDQLLSAHAGEEQAAPALSPAPVAPQKNGGFGRIARKLWYIPVIVLLLAAAFTVTLILLNRPPDYAKMIKDGEIELGMTKDEIIDLLEEPTYAWTSKDIDYDGIYSFLIDLDTYTYENADYFLYYPKREIENEQELWFGIEYTFLRLVFDENDELIEAFYRNTPDTEIDTYGDKTALRIKSYTPFTYGDGSSNGHGMVTFTDGSVYLGEIEEVRSDGRLSGLDMMNEIFSMKASTTSNGGSDNSTGNNNSGNNNSGNNSTGNNNSGNNSTDNNNSGNNSEICAACGDIDSTCREDDRLTGTPVLICQDCRELLFGD